MAKRLSDTAAVKGLPPGGDSSYESHTVSTRRIENGYVTCESVCKDGEYHSTERFSPEMPTSGAKGAVGDSSLSDAVKSIRGK